MTGKSIMSPMVRNTSIVGGEWIVTAQLVIDGRKVGAPHEVRYADSVLSKNPLAVGELVGRWMGELGVRLASQVGRRRR